MSTHPKERDTSMTQNASPPSTSSIPSTEQSNMANLRTFHGQSIFVGQLPDDFLRVSGAESDRNQIEMDQQLAASLQEKYHRQAQSHNRQWAPQFSALIDITCVEAKLCKNYGLLNMNPYIRLRLGHTIYESPTSNKGGKNPRWNHLIKCHLPKGIDRLSIEIFDESLLVPDELIAWASFKLPSKYFDFAEGSINTYEEEIPLSGKQGDDKEGVIYMVFTIKPISAGSPQSSMIATQIVYPNVIPIVPTNLHHINPSVICIQNGQSASTLLSPPPNPVREEDVKALQEMFPKIDLEVIKSVLTSERGNIDRAINNLLEINSTT